ncbi:MAG: hypothetical protein AB7O59_01955 [Pirellulales bacterium]
MTIRDAKTIAGRGQVQLRFAKRAAKVISSYQCLIVSADRQRAALLQQAASDGGWQTCVCDDTRSALAHLSRSFVHLGVVDLDGREPREFQPVMERLASSSGVLLIVCGNEGNFQEELWVRQLGAWLYLPGVTDASNLATLCGEARQIVERLAHPVSEYSVATTQSQRTNS